MRVVNCWENRMSVFNDCMEFIDTCRPYNNNAQFVSSQWRAVFIKICGLFGINKRGAKVLFEDACLGNWNHFHQTDKELSMTSDDWFRKFMDDVFYCSDRWSVDRLLRVHWEFRQWCYGVM